MVCPASAPTRSAAPCMRPVLVGRRAGPGARRAWWYASVSTAAWSRHRSGCSGKKGLIERAYRQGAGLGLAVWCADEAGPFQAVPHPGSSWRAHGQPATQPHEYVRGGTSKILTLFHPATGQVYLQPATACTNSVLHGWLKKELTAILARLPIPSEPLDAAETRAAWQDGLTEPFTLPEQLPPL